MFSLTENIHYKPQFHQQLLLQQQQHLQQHQIRSTTKQLPNTIFKGAMIDRIHNIRPGCGSCGK